MSLLVFAGKNEKFKIYFVQRKRERKFCPIMSITVFYGMNHKNNFKLKENLYVSINKMLKDPVFTSKRFVRVENTK